MCRYNKPTCLYIHNTTHMRNAIRFFGGGGGGRHTHTFLSVCMPPRSLRTSFEPYNARRAALHTQTYITLRWIRCAHVFSSVIYILNSGGHKTGARVRSGRFMSVRCCVVCKNVGFSASGPPASASHRGWVCWDRLWESHAAHAACKCTCKSIHVLRRIAAVVW